MIVDYADQETRATCASAAQVFRHWCQKSCVVANDGTRLDEEDGNLVFRAPSSAAVEEYTPIVGARRNNRVVLFARGDAKWVIDHEKREPVKWYEIQ